jgi:hypothetical protein
MLEIKHQSDTQIYATSGPVLIRIADGAPTEPSEIDRSHAMCLALLDAWPTIGSLLIVHHGTPIPSLTTMRYATQIMAGIEDRVVVGVTLLGLGYWAQAARVTASFFARFIRGNTFVLAGTVEEAAERMSFELVGLDHAQLHCACAELERRFRESSARRA